MNKAGREVVIVTGSSGLIGTRIIKRLVKNFQVVGFDKTGNPYPQEEAECICIDIKSEGKHQESFEPRAVCLWR